MKRLLAGLVVISLAGCGSGRSLLKPKTWFSRNPPAATATATAAPADPALSDPRPMVRQVTAVTVRRASGGVILIATGVPPGPGYWGAELLPLAKEAPVGGDIVYLFKVSPPKDASEPQPGRLTAARFVPDTALAGARRLIVRGETNARGVSP